VNTADADRFYQVYGRSVLYPCQVSEEGGFRTAVSCVMRSRSATLSAHDRAARSAQQRARARSGGVTIGTECDVRTLSITHEESTEEKET